MRASRSAIAGVRSSSRSFRTCSRLAILGASRIVVYDLRKRLFAHLQRLPMSFFRSRSTGDIVSRRSTTSCSCALSTGPGDETSPTRSSSTSGGRPHGLDVPAPDPLRDRAVSPLRPRREPPQQACLRPLANVRLDEGDPVMFSCLVGDRGEPLLHLRLRAKTRLLRRFTARRRGDTARSRRGSGAGHRGHEDDRPDVDEDRVGEVSSPRARRKSRTSMTSLIARETMSPVDRDRKRRHRQALQVAKRRLRSRRRRSGRRRGSPAGARPDDRLEDRDPRDGEREARDRRPLRPRLHRVDGVLEEARIQRRGGSSARGARSRSDPPPDEAEVVEYHARRAAGSASREQDLEEELLVHFRGEIAPRSADAPQAPGEPFSHRLSQPPQGPSISRSRSVPIPLRHGGPSRP